MDRAQWRARDAVRPSARALYPVVGLPGAESGHPGSRSHRAPYHAVGLIVIEPAGVFTVLPLPIEPSALAKLAIALPICWL